VARHDTTRREKIFFCGLEMLEFTVAGHRQVTTRTDEDCRLDWKKVFCLSLPVNVNARRLLSCSVGPYNVNRPSFVDSVTVPVIYC
jgi:hypothetical protein